MVSRNLRSGSAHNHAIHRELGVVGDKLSSVNERKNVIKCKFRKCQSMKARIFFGGIYVRITHSLPFRLCALCSWLCADCMNGVRRMETVNEAILIIFLSKNISIYLMQRKCSGKHTFLWNNFLHLLAARGAVCELWRISLAFFRWIHFSNSSRNVSLFNYIFSNRYNLIWLHVAISWNLFPSLDMYK